MINLSLSLRLAYAVLRVDTYFSILADYPPSVRYQEICIPLPKSTHLWSATSEDERRKLQWNEPAGREKARFCYLMRDALDFTHGRHLPGFLTAEDYHLGLCSYQAGTWEAAHKAHSSESDELITNALPREHVQIWRSQLDFWYFSLTSNNQPEQEYSGITTVSDADGIFTPLSLILWHLSSLTLYAPVRFLQSQCSTDRITPKDKTRLRDWVASPCARTAVRNAAQICRVVEDESSSPAVTTRLLLNPLVVPGILKSAIITTLYAHYSLTCSKCTGMSPVDLVDLFNTDDEDTRLVNWMEHGNGLATWGPSEIAICRCRVLELSDWFRCAVRASKRAEIEILAFVATLDKGYLPLRDLS
ncbi:MAG: hypothetical protein LQ342_003116 [Letrouitia transgressa]|nr:MAG: hypothetical protein LQ342_003116 [Letrouitia transgressa]